MEFTNNLNDLILKSGKSRTQIAKEIGISEANIRSWMNGSYPAIDKVIKISKYFSCSIDWLVGSDYKFSNEEIRILEAYRKADHEHKRAAELILNVKKEKNSSVSKTG